MGSEGKDLRDNGQTFLRNGRGRRAFAEKRADRLIQAVERRAQVDPTFVDFQQPDFPSREPRIIADLDVIAAGRRIRHDTVGQLDAHRLVLKILLKPGRELFHGLARVMNRLFPAEDRFVRQVVQDIRHHVAQIGQIRIAGMKAVRGAAVKPLGDLGKGPAATVGQQVHDFAILLAHARHDLPGTVKLAELAADVAFDEMELVKFLFRIKRERPVEVVVAGDRR